MEPEDRNRLIKLDEIHPEIRKIAVAWGESMCLSIMDTMKLGMDITSCIIRIQSDKDAYMGQKEWYKLVITSCVRILSKDGQVQLAKTLLERNQKLHDIDISQWKD